MNRASRRGEKHIYTRYIPTTRGQTSGATRATFPPQNRHAFRIRHASDYYLGNARVFYADLLCNPLHERSVSRRCTRCVVSTNTTTKTLIERCAPALMLPFISPHISPLLPSNLANELCPALRVPRETIEGVRSSSCRNHILGAADIKGATIEKRSRAQTVRARLFFKGAARLLKSIITHRVCDIKKALNL